MHQQNAVPYNNPAVSVGMIKLCRYVCLSHDWGCLSVYLRICKSLTCCCPYVPLGADTYASSEWQMISLLVTPPFGTCLWCHVCVSQIQRIVANLVCPQILNTCSFLQVRCDLGVLCSWLRAKTRTGSTRHKDICHLWCHVHVSQLAKSRELVPTCHVAKSEYFAGEKDKHLVLIAVERLQCL